MSLLIQNAQILNETYQISGPLDLLIEGQVIRHIGKGIATEGLSPEQIIDGKERLVVPGFVNAHLHSHDRFDKGRFPALPLEIWMLLYNPPIVRRDWTQREVYLRTLLGGMEMLRSGTTTVIDDVYLGWPVAPEHIDAVFQAYADLGIRADVSVGYSDKPYHETVPYLAECLPEDLKRPGPLAAPSSTEILSLWRDLADKWQGRVSFVLSPSGPQRCSDRFLEQTWALSKERDLPVLIHVLETRIQALTGRKFYGKTLVEHMAALGLLTPRSVLIHGVWMTDSDLDLVARGGCTVVHNPGSNLKLGSGIAPVAGMRKRGICVALGTDNHNANDSCSMLEATKLASLIHTVQHGRYQEWVSSTDVLDMATQGGAHALRDPDRTGRIAEGHQADLAFYRLDTNAFLPRNNLANQLVFCETGSSLDRVIVAGKTVLAGGRIQTIDESAIMAEIWDSIDEIQTKVLNTRSAGEHLRPYLERSYELCLNDPEMMAVLAAIPQSGRDQPARMEVPSG